MTSETAWGDKEPTLNFMIQELRRHGLNGKSCGAVIGLLGGIIAPLIGSALTTIGWYTGPEWHGFSVQRDGLVLLVLTIPLLIFGAHCLDLIDQENEETLVRKTGESASGDTKEETE